MFRQYALSITISIGCILLSSCATFKEQAVGEHQAEVEPVSWKAEKKLRQQVDVWELRGRLGVQTKTDGGVMDIIWKQSGEEYSIRLIAPLGAGTYLIQGDETVAEIRYPDGKKKRLSNIDKIFTATLDVDLPVTAIKDWVRGIPAAALKLEHVDWNRSGQLHHLQQSGWNIEMTKYAGTKLKMPHAIYVSRDDDSDLDIRLLLRQWLFDN